MLFQKSDLRYIEADHDDLREFDKIELAKFNDYFGRYFKEIKKESEDEIKNRANDLLAQRENLLHCKYFSTEHGRTINMQRKLAESEVDWIFVNLRFAFYDKADYHFTMMNKKEMKDTRRIFNALEMCKYLDPKIKNDITRLLINRELGIKNTPVIQNMNYRPTGSKKPYFWASKVAIFIIVEFLKEKYNFKILKASQLITGICYNLDLISKNTTEKRSCPVLSAYKDARNRYRNESLLPFKYDLPHSYKTPPKFPQGLDIPHLIRLNEKMVYFRAEHRAEAKK